MEEIDDLDAFGNGGNLVAQPGALVGNFPGFEGLSDGGVFQEWQGFVSEMEERFRIVV